LEKSETGYTAVVLAADRGQGDPVAAAAGVPSKSLVPVGGRAMVLRVLDALDESAEVNSCILCGPPQSVLEQEAELQGRITSGNVGWVENQATPSLSTYYVLNSLQETTPVLVTTADHALLSSKMIDYFCSQARTKNCDVVAALAPYELVKGAYPGTKRTVIRLQDGAYCGCNLFAFLTPRGRSAASFWQKLESRRKKTLHMASGLGLRMAIRYLLGRLSLSEGLAHMSRRLGLSAAVITMPFPEAAVDVDTVSDWKLVESIVADRTS
jgi:GTP:adenosylcobinamide-phosphate guanylyltransferase